MKALVYLRVSTEEQAEKGYSIPAQREECIKKAMELGCGMSNILVFADEGVSGAIFERPQLMAAMDIIKEEKGSISYFICYDSSRLSRNAAHQLIIVDEIKKSGTKLVFVRNNFQDDAEGRFQLTIMAAVDEYERARLRLRTEMGKRAKAAQHKLTHNPGIYGYNYDAKEDILVINEENSQNVKNIYRLLVEDRKGPAEIAHILNSLGVMSQRQKLWSRVTVRRILTNPSYLGVLYIRRYDTRDCHLNKFREKSEKIKVREKPQDEWVSVQIPQIIDKATWEKAQLALISAKNRDRTGNDNLFMLDSLLKCGICGNSMKGKRIINGSHSYCYYICRAKYNGTGKAKCGSELVPAEEVENAIWNFIKGRIVYYIRKENNAEKIAQNYAKDILREMKNTPGNMEKAKKEKERITIMFQKGYISEDELRDRINKLEASSNYRENKVTLSMQKIKRINDKEDVLYIMEDALEKLDVFEKRRVIGYMANEILISDKLLSIRPSCSFSIDTTLVSDVTRGKIA